MFGIRLFAEQAWRLSCVGLSDRRWRLMANEHAWLFADLSYSQNTIIDLYSIPLWGIRHWSVPSSLVDCASILMNSVLFLSRNLAPNVDGAGGRDGFSGVTHAHVIVQRCERHDKSPWSRPTWRTWSAKYVPEVAALGAWQGKLQVMGELWCPAFVCHFAFMYNNDLQHTPSTNAVFLSCKHSYINHIDKGKSKWKLQ